MTYIFGGGTFNTPQRFSIYKKLFINKELDMYKIQDKLIEDGKL